MSKFKSQNWLNKPWMSQKHGPKPASFYKQTPIVTDTWWPTEVKAKSKKRHHGGTSLPIVTPFESKSLEAKLPPQEFRLSPDLTLCPPWARYWAQDFDGTFTWFAEKPTLNFVMGKWISASPHLVVEAWQTVFSTMLKYVVKKHQSALYVAPALDPYGIYLSTGWCVPWWAHTLVALPRLRFKRPEIWWAERVLVNINCDLTSSNDVTLASSLGAASIAYLSGSVMAVAAHTWTQFKSWHA